jgi:hypothetical protein
VRKNIVVGVAVLLLLSGCSGDDASPGASEGTDTQAPLTLPPGSTSGTPDAPSPAAATTNDRGNVVQATGQQAGIQGPDGNQAVIFSVDEVAVDQACSGQAPRPVNGHYLGVHVRVTTGDLGFLGDTWSMSAADFGLRQPDGSTFFDLATEGARSCLDDDEAFPAASLRPDEEYEGMIVLDSPATTGTLVFSPPSLHGNGWEWTF